MTVFFYIFACLEQKTQTNSLFVWYYYPMQSRTVHRVPLLALSLLLLSAGAPPDHSFYHRKVIYCAYAHRDNAPWLVPEFFLYF